MTSPSGWSIEYADRLDIRELLDRYSHAVDFLDAELLASVFAPDATVDYSDLAGTPQFADTPTAAEGLDAITALYAALMRASFGAMHNMTNHLIELHGDVAHTRTYMHVNAPHFSGLYRCTCVRTDHGWRIKYYEFILHTVERPTTKKVAQTGEA